MKWFDNTSEALKWIVVLAGIYYLIKKIIIILFACWKGFKTFLLPICWERNFITQYGNWAGKS